MEMEHKYNTRNPAVKRLMREACELKEATEEYCARPLEDNLFEWHFTVHGSPGSEYEGGVYHGRILLPPEYPMKPPNIILLTPNGRFEINKKICLSISGHHPETWQPSWSIRTALLALIAFMSSPGNGAIGSLDYCTEERKILAKKSQQWSCSECGKIIDLLCSTNSQPITEEETNIISQIALKAEESSPAKVTTNESGDVDTEIEEVLKDIDNLNEELNKTVSDIQNCENSSEIRQRVANQNESLNQQASSLQQQTVAEPSGSAELTNVLMWVIVAAILLLLARRLFFL